MWGRDAVGALEGGGSVTGRAAQLAESIRMVVLDVDGVLTDGSVLYGETNQAEIKAFNIKDGLGIKLLLDNGIEVAIITGRSSEAVTRRMEELAVKIVLQGREDKREALLEILKPRSIPLAQVAYMGDDLPDLDPLRMVGLATCPSDAVSAVCDVADWRAPCPGGRGAVRALSDFILGAQGMRTPYQEPDH